jgi:hypothetical protein
MAPQYVVSLYNSSGVLQEISIDYAELSIRRTVNAPDMAVVTWARTSIVTIAYNSIMTITRSDEENGISPAVEFSGLVRAINRTVGEMTTITLTAVGWEALLGDRVIAWKASTANRSKFTAVPAETIMKTLFNYNLGSLATTANGRAKSGVLTGASTTASAGTGTVLTVDCAYKNLLETMQEVAEDGGGDFSITYTAPATWSFAWHLGQLGTNRTATVRLSVALGTVADFVNNLDRIQDFTAVIIAGQGEAKARRVDAAPTSAYPTGLALRESFVDFKAARKATASMLQSYGTILLDAQKLKRQRISVSLMQNAALRYGRDYFLGDLVTVLDNTTPITQKVDGVEMQFTPDGQELINVILNYPYE